MNLCEKFKKKHTYQITPNSLEIVFQSTLKQLNTKV